MMLSSYKKGYNFERKVKKLMENNGFFCIRQGKSKFPDLVCLGDFDEFCVIFVECKMRKYLSKKEKKMFMKLKEMLPSVNFMVAYSDNHKIRFYEP